MAFTPEVSVLRTEDYGHGDVTIYREALVPMSADSIKVLGGEPWYDEGDIFLVQWWQAYGQDATVDVYVTDSSDPGNHGDGFAVGDPVTSDDFDALVQQLAEGQWQWILTEMGDWDIEEIADDAGVSIK